MHFSSSVTAAVYCSRRTMSCAWWNSASTSWATTGTRVITKSGAAKSGERVRNMAFVNLERRTNRGEYWIMEGAEMMMRVMLLRRIGETLVAERVPVPRPAPGQVLVKVSACAVCRTDLHVVDGELTEPKLPLVPGHEIVGRVEELGVGVENFRIGDRVGIPWLGWSCGECEYC